MQVSYIEAKHAIIRHAVGIIYTDIANEMARTAADGEYDKARELGRMVKRMQIYIQMLREDNYTLWDNTTLDDAMEDLRFWKGKLEEREA